MTMRRLLLVGMASLALALAGCNGDDPEPQPSVDLDETMAPSTSAPAATPSESATPSPTPSPSATPTEAAVPEDLTTVADDGVVTIAEAQAIIDIQTEIYNAAIIDLLTRPAEVQGGVGASFTDELARVYVGRALDLYFQAWDGTAQAGFEGANRSDPSGVVDTVQEVLEVRPGCFVLRVSRDQTGLTPGDSGLIEDYWIRQAQVDRLAQNPSGWHRANDTNTEPSDSLCDQEIPQ